MALNVGAGVDSEMGVVVGSGGAQAISSNAPNKMTNSACCR